MNILTDQLPTAIRVNDKVYEVNSNFRDCLRIIMAFEDNELTDFEKKVVLVNGLYQEMPDSRDTPSAIRQGVKFLDGGNDKPEEEGHGLRLFSFTHDARFIFSAFQQTHGIDLQNTEYMHWWQFMTLFMDIGSETFFSNLVSLRKRVKTGKASKEEKQVAREMGSVFEVPEIDTRSIEERELERTFMNRVKAARERKKVLNAQGL